MLQAAKLLQPMPLLIPTIASVFYFLNLKVSDGEGERVLMAYKAGDL